MNEPGDPDTPPSTEPARPGAPARRESTRDEVDHDDMIGFASPAALAGRTRTPEPMAEARTEPAEDEPELPFVDPFPTRVEGAPFDPLAASIPPLKRAPEPVPARAIETAEAERPVSRFGQRREIPADIDGAMSLYAVYALILFSVPTFGAAAAIALLAVLGRPGPQGEVAASHFLYQKRTLLAAAGLAVLGGILIALGLGVFVLFVLAVWLIVRGAFGVLKLKAGRPIASPRSWLF